MVGDEERERFLEVVPSLGVLSVLHEPRCRDPVGLPRAGVDLPVLMVARLPELGLRWYRSACNRIRRVVSRRPEIEARRERRTVRVMDRVNPRRLMFRLCNIQLSCSCGNDLRNDFFRNPESITLFAENAFI